MKKQAPSVRTADPIDRNPEESLVVRASGRTSWTVDPIERELRSALGVHRSLKSERISVFRVIPRRRIRKLVHLGISWCRWVRWCWCGSRPRSISDRKIVVSAARRWVRVLGRNASRIQMSGSGPVGVPYQRTSNASRIESGKNTRDQRSRAIDRSVRNSSRSSHRNPSRSLSWCRVSVLNVKNEAVVR